MPSAPVRSLALISLAAASVLFLSACIATTEAAPKGRETATSTPSPSVSTKPAASASATPMSATPTPTATADTQPPREVAPAGYSSCDAMLRADILEGFHGQGWISWDLVQRETPPNGSVFDTFPGGQPAGTMACRYGAGPEVGTDNFFDLTWAPIDAAQSARFQAHLESEGFVRVDGAYTVQYSVRALDGWADAEGWGQTFEFSPTDLRWVSIRDELQYFAPMS